MARYSSSTTARYINVNIELQPPSLHLFDLETAHEPIVVMVPVVSPKHTYFITVTIMAFKTGDAVKTVFGVRITINSARVAQISPIKKDDVTQSLSGIQRGLTFPSFSLLYSSF